MKQTEPDEPLDEACCCGLPECTEVHWKCSRCGNAYCDAHKCAPGEDEPSCPACKDNDEDEWVPMPEGHGQSYYAWKYNRDMERMREREDEGDR